MELESLIPYERDIYFHMFVRDKNKEMQAKKGL